MNFKLFGVEFNVSFYCFCVLALSYFFDRSGYLTAAIISAVLHETGHLSAMMLLGGKMPKKIALTPFGARIYNSRLWTLPAFVQLIIYLSGPAVNILICLISALFFKSKSVWFLVNFGLALFNLLPVLPLDGGNSLKCLLTVIFKEDKADILGEIISACLLFVMAAAGFVYIFRKKNNYSLFALTVYLCFLFLNRNGLIRFKNKRIKKKGIKNVP